MMMMMAQPAMQSQTGSMLRRHLLEPNAAAGQVDDNTALLYKLSITLAPILLFGLVLCYCCYYIRLQRSNPVGYWGFTFPHWQSTVRRNVHHSGEEDVKADFPVVVPHAGVSHFSSNPKYTHPDSLSTLGVEV